MPRIVTTEDLRARLGQELDALRDSDEPVYVTKRGRSAAVLVDSGRFDHMVKQLEELEDALAVYQALERREEAIPWSEVRGA